MTAAVLAVDLGGTKVEAALVDASFSIIPSTRSRRPTGPGRTERELTEQVTAVVQSAIHLGKGVPIVGIGVGTAGPVNVELGQTSPVNLPMWRGFPLRDAVAGAAGAMGLHVPVGFALDGQCIALAESRLGAARGHAHALGMVVSTGIGGGLVSSGRLVPGAHGNAGHIGQMEVAGFTVEETGDISLEGLASGPSTVRWAQGRGWHGSTGEELAVDYAAGNATARGAVERSGKAIGRALASLTTAIDLDIAVIGGGFSKVTPDFLGLIRDAALAHSYFDYGRQLRIEAAGLDHDGPLIGAALLAFDARTDTDGADT